MNAMTTFYPLAKVVDKGHGPRNGIVVFVAYAKGTGVYVSMTLALLKPKEPSGFQGFTTALMGDPHGRGVLESLARVNAKKLNQHWENTRRELTMQVGHAWGILQDFAKRHGLELAEDPAMEPIQPEPQPA